MEQTYQISLGPVLAHKLPRPGRDATEAEREAARKQWRRLNGSYKNQRMEASALAAAIFAGHCFTTWHSNQWRHSKNYLAGQHIGIDFDAGMSIAALEADPLVTKWGGVLYTTHSHTPEMPRTRVVFLLDTPIQQADNYAKATQALLWLFATADPAGSDPCRNWYGCPPRRGTIKLLPNVMPLPLLQEIVASWTKTGELARQAIAQRQTRTWHTDHAMLEAALKVIDPMVLSYKDWFKAIVAIKSVFPGQDGLDLADQWARGYEGEIADKWDGIHRTDVSVGWIYTVAGERGFSTKEWRDAHRS